MPRESRSCPPSGRQPSHSLPADYLRLKGRFTRSKTQHSCTFNSMPYNAFAKARVFVDESSRMSRHYPSSSSTASVNVLPTTLLYRRQFISKRKKRITQRHLSNRQRLLQQCSDSAGISMRTPSHFLYRNNACLPDSCQELPAPIVSPAARTASSTILGAMDDQRTSSITSSRQDPHLGNESRTGSNATPIMTTTTSSPSSSVTPDSASALFPATPSDTDQDRTRELTMLKHEAFQELAIQTQRFDDLFIAKMAYWENLGPDEKTQWLERGRNPVEDLQQQHQHHNQSQGQGGPTGDCMDRDEIDELVDALECRATVKDYSALIAFEQQAELEKRRRSRMDASGLDAAELDTDSVYELGDMEVF